MTSALGGASEGIQEGITGFSFKERDVVTLAARLVCALTNDTIANALSLASPKFVAEHFCLARCTAALERLYDDLTT